MKQLNSITKKETSLNLNITPTQKKYREMTAKERGKLIAQEMVENLRNQKLQGKTI